MTYIKLPITKIQISDANPRKAFDEGSIQGPAQSIKTDGLLQSLTVGKAKGKKKLHPIISGERRFRTITHLVGRVLSHEDILDRINWSQPRPVRIDNLVIAPRRHLLLWWYDRPYV